MAGAVSSRFNQSRGDCRVTGFLTVSAGAQNLSAIRGGGYVAMRLAMTSGATRRGNHKTRHCMEHAARLQRADGLELCVVLGLTPVLSKMNCCNSFSCFFRRPVIVVQLSDVSALAHIRATDRAEGLRCLNKLESSVLTGFSNLCKHFIIGWGTQRLSSEVVGVI